MTVTGRPQDFFRVNSLESGNTEDSSISDHDDLVSDGIRYRAIIRMYLSKLAFCVVSYTNASSCGWCCIFYTLPEIYLYGSHGLTVPKALNKTLDR